MKRTQVMLLSLLTVFMTYVSAAEKPPLKLLQRVKMPGIKKSFCRVARPPYVGFVTRLHRRRFPGSNAR